MEHTEVSPFGSDADTTLKALPTAASKFFEFVVGWPVAGQFAIQMNQIFCVSPTSLHVRQSDYFAQRLKHIWKESAHLQLPANHVHKIII
jgi:hypothetical protein